MGSKWGLKHGASGQGSPGETQGDFLEKEKPGVSPEVKKREDSTPERGNPTHKGVMAGTQWAWQTAERSQPGRLVERRKHISCLDTEN